MGTEPVIEHIVTAPAKRLYAVALLIDDTFPKYDHKEVITSQDQRNTVVRLFREGLMIAEWSMKSWQQIQRRLRVDLVFIEAIDPGAAELQAALACTSNVGAAIAKELP